MFRGIYLHIESRRACVWSTKRQEMADVNATLAIHPGLAADSFLSLEPPGNRLYIYADAKTVYSSSQDVRIVGAILQSLMQ